MIAGFWTLGCAAVIAIAAAGCGASAAEVKTAQTSGYQTDFAVVYGETLQVVRDHYPNVKEDARSGIIKTAWHPMRIQQGTSGEGGPVQGPSESSIPTSLQTSTALRQTYFIRFFVYITGGKPWRVRVEGQASQWKLGEVPSPLTGAATPPWLAGRTESLQVEIYRRLAKYAVPVKPLETVEVSAPPEVPAEKYAQFPANVRPLVVSIAQALTARNYPALRATMIEEFAWTNGAPGSADTAISMWQADSQWPAALAQALEQCKPNVTSERISCQWQNQKAQSFRLELVLVNTIWRFSGFLTE